MVIRVLKRSYLEVDKALFHFAFFGHEPFIFDVCRGSKLTNRWFRGSLSKMLSRDDISKTHLLIPVSLEVEDCEATNVSDAIDVDGELSEEVDDGRSAFWKG